MTTIRMIPALTAALALTATLGLQTATAQEATPEAKPAVTSTLTRAAERAEVAQARAQGQLADGGEAGRLAAAPQLRSRPISNAFKGRAEQRAEMAAAVRRGELPVSNEFQ